MCKKILPGGESRILSDMLQKHRVDPRFLERILWYEETTYSQKDQYVKLYNLHEWDVELRDADYLKNT